MLPDRASNPGPLTYESGALPIALRGPAYAWGNLCRSERVSVGRERSRRSTTVLVMFKTIVVLRRFATIF